VFRETDELEKFEGDDVPDVGIRLGDLLPLVALAQKRHFIWLKDFLDDEIRISVDLHDVLQAFRSAKPSA
jgi:hypothetical protein